MRRAARSVTERVGGFALHFVSFEAGADLYRRTGEALPAAALQGAETADAILLGAMGLPDVRYPDGTEVAPHLDFRDRFELYAGVRPIRVLPVCRRRWRTPRAAQIDCVLIRESTEGLFASRKMSRRDGPDVVLDTLRISRSVTERLCEFAFRLAQAAPRQGARRPRHLRGQGERAAVDGVLPQHLPGEWRRAIRTSPPTACTWTRPRCAWCGPRGNST